MVTLTTIRIEVPPNANCCAPYMPPMTSGTRHTMVRYTDPTTVIDMTEGVELLRRGKGDPAVFGL